MSWWLVIAIIGLEVAVIGGAVAVMLAARRARERDRRLAAWRLRQVAQVRAMERAGWIRPEDAVRTAEAHVRGE